MAEITLSAPVRNNLLALQNTARLLGKTQERLATGLKVNSALDDPNAFFTSAALDARASDLNRLLDTVDLAVQTIKAADQGITAITKLVESAQALARQALLIPTTSTSTAATVTGTGASVAADTAAVSTGTVAITADTAAAVTGTGASLSADAAGVRTGNVDVSAFTAGAANAGNLVINGTTIAIADGDSIATIVGNINAQTGTTGVTASVDGGTGFLTLTGADADTDVTVDASSTAATLSALGLTAGTSAATNLLTQGFSASQTLTLNIGSNNNTITFGTGVGEVSTLAELATALGSISGGTASVDASGNVTVTAGNTTDSVVIGGTATVGDLGLTAGTTAPGNAQIAGFTGTLTVQVGSGTASSINLSSIANRAQLETALAGLASATGATITINGSNQVVITAPNNSDTITISGAGATELGLATATPTAGPPPAGFVRNDEQSIFISQTIAGGAITVFDQAGAPVNVQFRWGKVGNSPATWNLFYLENSQPAAPSDATWRNVGVNYTFSANGQITAPLTNPTISGLSVDGVSLGNIVLNHGQGGISQFADPNGVARVTEIDQNGYAAGELVGVSLGEEGRILANYTNGESLAVAQVPLVSFNGDNGLRKLDGGAFAETEQSGAALLGAQGTILGQSLEGSNTDIADEFTKLIVTQQAYAAGTRIISTSDEMLQEALNMVR